MRRISDIVELTRQRDEEAESAAASAANEKGEVLAVIEADWHAKREEAVKVSARNFHDMHQEALRKALFEKDVASEEAIEKVSAK